MEMQDMEVAVQGIQAVAIWTGEVDLEPGPLLGSSECHYVIHVL